MPPDVSDTTAADAADASHASTQDPSSQSVNAGAEPDGGRPGAAAKISGPTKHPIPYEDHQRVVDGFHQRLDALDWASRLDRAEVEEAIETYRLMQRDPQTLVERLSSRTEQAPGPDLQDEQGRPYYSVEQAAKQARWETDRAIRGYDSQLGRRLERLEGFVTRGEAVESAQQQLARAQTWPGFTDHLSAIADYVERANRLGQTVTLAEAYIDLVVPALSTTTRREVLSELQDTSARTGDTINPARRASPSPAADDTRPLKDLLAEEFRKRERESRGAA